MTVLARLHEGFAIDRHVHRPADVYVPPRRVRLVLAAHADEDGLGLVHDLARSLSEAMASAGVTVVTTSILRSPAATALRAPGAAVWGRHRFRSAGVTRLRGRIGYGGR